MSIFWSAMRAAIARALLYASEHPEQAIDTVKTVAKTFDKPERG